MLNCIGDQELRKAPGSFFMEDLWRPFFWLWLLFRLHESFMATILLHLVPFSASWRLHGYHFSGSGSFFGFMRASWRPFFCLSCLFRLHRRFMATIFLALVLFRLHRRSMATILCFWCLFGFTKASNYLISRYNDKKGNPSMRNDR